MRFSSRRHQFKCLIEFPIPCAFVKQMLQLIGMAEAQITDAPPQPPQPPQTDGRRELGERTRQRLLQATRELLAERGEDAIRLRDITDAAQVNVAAVNYHFGCLKALCTAAIKEAIETVQAETV